ncbi:hypothetical protein IE4872_PD01780 (plasmid) [Rhizobium gallicum]|uniref:Uncharacterized protein n=4 Tax=Rhizobium TaxID=379 RepID=A0A1L5NWP7_9HYPH|nr:hypothetical protein IE4872_PD01780 [Rhizobium gallicum]
MVLFEDRLGSWSMGYEWDDARERRAYAIKVVSIVLASAVTAGVPTWIVAKAMGL